MGQTLRYLLLHVSITTLLFAGPPMLSNDPFVPDYGQFEINIAAALEERNNAIISAPIFDVNYGIYPNVQLTLESAYISSELQQGFDALEIALKWNFFTSSNFSIAVEPQYSSYPLDTIFNEGEVYTLSLDMNIKLLNNLNWVINPSYIHSQEEDNHFELGSYLQYTHQAHNLYLEGFIEEEKNGDKLFSLLNAGYLYQYNKLVAFMFSIGHEIQAREKKAIISYVGTQLVF